MTTKKPTWFDSFFEAMSTTPEYKDMMSSMSNISSMEKELKSMDEKNKKFWELNTILKDSFDTPEAREAWKKAKPQDNSGDKSVKTEKQSWDAKKEDEWAKLEIIYFENTEPATWWFKWVAGMKELKTELRESFINPLQFRFFVQKLAENPTDETEKLYKELYKTYENFKVDIPTGILLYGPPGTGKTYISKKLAEELNAGFIKKSVWEFGSSYVHQTSKNIHNFFKQAKEASQKWPIIFFLDEIDSLVSARWWNTDASKAEEVSQFLQEFNNLDDAPNLIIIGATNRPDHLDSAILRSGRFDKKIYVWEADYTARKELFEIFIEKKKRPHTKLDYRELAMLTEWYVAADIEAIVEEAARDASRWILDLAELIKKWNHNIEEIQNQLSKHTISMEALEQAIKDTTPSIKMVDMSVFDDWEKSLE